MSKLTQELLEIQKSLVMPKPVFTMRYSWNDRYEFDLLDCLTAAHESPFASELMTCAYVQVSPDGRVESTVDIQHARKRCHQLIKRSILTILSTPTSPKIKKRKHSDLYVWYDTVLIGTMDSDPNFENDMVSIYKWIISSKNGFAADQAKNAIGLLHAVAIKYGAKL